MKRILFLLVTFMCYAAYSQSIEETPPFNNTSAGSFRQAVNSNFNVVSDSLKLLSDSLETKVPYAPSDGEIYGMQDSSWVIASGGGGDANISDTNTYFTSKFAGDTLKEDVIINNTKVSYTDATSVGLNTTHRTSNGSDHTYIDQSVVNGSTPTFTNTNFTEATDKNYVSDAELVIIGNTSGSNTGDQDLSGKQDNLTLTTVGSSGASTLIGSTLNIPEYTGGGGEVSYSDTLTTISAKYPVDSLKEALNNTVDPDTVFVSIGDSSAVYDSPYRVQYKIDSTIEASPGGSGSSEIMTIFGIPGTTPNMNLDTITNSAIDTMQLGMTFINGLFVSDSTDRISKLDSNLIIDPPLSLNDTFQAFFFSNVTALTLKDTASGGGGGDNGLLTGLVSLWELNESSAPIIDAHGDALTPSDSTDGLTYSQTSVANLGTSVNFDGTDAFIRPNDVGDALQLSTFSISFWFKVGAGSDNLLRYNDAAAAGSGVANGWTIYTNSGGFVNFRLYQTGVNDVVSNSSLIDNAWHNIICTYDGSTAKMYADGTLQTDTEVVSTTFDYSSARFEWGTNGFINDFGGDMDQVGIWDEALIQIKVDSVYDSGDGRAYSNWTLE